MFIFHKHIWIEEAREKMYYDNRYDRFTGHYNENAYPSPVLIITFKCLSCVKRKQQELKGWLGEQLDSKITEKIRGINQILDKMENKNA